jgi:hypothetical protein
MFGSKCMRCGVKVSSESNFCSMCGSDLSRNYDPRDYGMLGKDDNGPIADFPFGLSAIIGNLMNEMNKQMKNAMNQASPEGRQTPTPKKMQNNPAKKVKSSGISISISTSGNGQPKIDIKKFGDAMKTQEMEEELEEVIPANTMTDEKARIVSKLPKEEAKSRVKRLANKLVYEIEIPGVKSLDDIIINRLETGLEIKAFTTEKSYFKSIPVALPISRYKLSKNGILVIELAED